MQDDSRLTAEGFIAITKILRIRKGVNSDAAELVFVLGYTVPKAAEKIGIPYKSAWKTVSIILAGIRLARTV